MHAQLIARTHAPLPPHPLARLARNLLRDSRPLRFSFLIRPALPGSLLVPQIQLTHERARPKPPRQAPQKVQPRSGGQLCIRKVRECRHKDRVQSGFVDWNLHCTAVWRPSKYFGPEVSIVRGSGEHR